LPDTPEEPEALMEQKSRGLLLINAILAANRESLFLFD
jgi:hypothetical protein